MIFTESTIFRHIEKERDSETEKVYAMKFLQKLREFYKFQTDNVPDVELSKVLRFVAQYQMCCEKKGPRPETGLFINGFTGRGKTLMATILSMELHIQFYTMREIDEQWAINPERCQNEYSAAFGLQESVIIDDIGAEAGTRRFGNEPVLQSLLYRMYDNWRWFGKLVIATSNLSTCDQYPSDERTILGNFGDRVDSRFGEMFEIVKFVGKQDFRKPYGRNKNEI